jgi:PKD repeat protein
MHTFVPYRNSTLASLLLLFTSFGFQACEDDPKPPTAQITSPAEAITVGVWLDLSGAESLNPKGEAKDLTFQWRLLTKPIGSEAEFVDTESMTPELFPDLPGSYEVALTVKTSEVGSAEVYATIEAGPCGAQNPIITEVQQYPLEPGVGSSVQLYVLAEDPDLSEACVTQDIDDETPSNLQVGEAPFEVPSEAYNLTYQWRMIVRPVQSQAVLTLNQSVTPVFNPDVSGDYQFEVIVTDRQGAISESRIHIVSVSACGEGRPSLSLSLPESGTSGEAVEINTEVSDADTDCGLEQSFSFAWQLSSVPAGSQALLNDTTLASPSFIPDLPGGYTVTGQVIDQDGYRSSTVSATINIDTCGTRAPIISEILAQGLSFAEEEVMAGAEMAGAEMAGAEMAGAEEITGWDDQLIHIGEVVAFSATVSDSDLEEGCDLDTRLDYHWSMVRLPASSQATLNRPDARTPSLVADVAGEYTVRLVVSDAQGHQSEPVEVTFVVESCGGQAPQGEVSFTPLNPQSGALIAFQASFTDPDQECTETSLSYMWRFESLPAGSQAHLNNAQAMTPSFVADLPGSYDLSLVVSDNTGRESEVQLTTIQVSDCGANIPQVDTITHEPELVNAGQALRFNAVISDFDLDPSCGRTEQFTYHWLLSASPANSHATLMLDETASPSLMTDVPGEYAVSLMVRDMRGFESAVFSHSFVVGACGFSQPELSLSASTLAPSTGSTVALNATVVDADNTAPCDEGETFAYAWRVIEAPAGSQANLLNSNAKTPSLMVDVSGVYVVSCVVMDSRGRVSTESTLTLNTNGCGDNSPVIQDVIVDPNNRVGLPVRLEVVADDADNDLACALGQELSYVWRLTSVPVGSSTQILNAQLSVASFIPDVVGDYSAEITVTDEMGIWTSQSITVSVNQCGQRTPVVDSALLSSDDSRVGTPVTANVVVSDIDENEPSCNLEQNLTVMWEILSAPIGSEVQFEATDRLITSFTPDLPGNYEVRVRVRDQSGLMSAWLVEQISINNCGLSIPVVNQISRSSAAPYNVGELIRLNADVSDADLVVSCLPNQTHRYQWRLISAPTHSMASLMGVDLTEVDFTPDVAGTYVIGLIVTDDTGLSSVEFRNAFTVEFCGGQSPDLTTITSDSLTPDWTLGMPVRLTSDAVDRDVSDCGLNDSLTYNWALISIPVGSASQLNDAHLATPSLTPDIEGEYTLSLTVHDESGQATTLEQSFNASACGAQRPLAIINAISPVQSNVSPLLISSGDTVQLDASDSVDRDITDCGQADTLSYQWTLLRVPPASLATLNLDQGLTPWFVADVEGLYRVRLVVYDGALESDPAIFELNAN